MKVVITIFAIFSLLFIIVESSYSQTIQLENITTQNGLPNNSIQAIHKDSKGYIWLGTNAGLCKYNGSNIDIYTTKDGLSGNKIWTITESKDGVLWVGTYDNGISYYDNGMFTEFKLNDTINKHVRCSKYSNEYNTLVFGTDRGLIVKKNDSVFYFNNKSLNIDKFQVIDIHEVESVFYIYTYWAKPTYIYNPKTNSLTKFGAYYSRDFKNIASGIINNNGDTIIGYNRNNTAILKADRIIKFENTGQVFDMCKGKNDDVWLAGWDISLHGRSGGLFKIKSDSIFDYTDKFNIPTRAIWSLYYDTLENTLFVGTNDRGLFIHKNETFKYFDFNKGDVIINDIKYRDKKLWVATNNYVFKIMSDSILETYDKKYFAKLGGNSKTYPYGDFYANPDAVLSANYIDTDEYGNIHLATRGGFFKDNGSNFEYEKTGSDPFVFFNDKLFSVGWGHLQEFTDLKDYKNTVKHNAWKENTPVDVHKIKKHKNAVWFLSWAQGLFVLKDNKYTWLNKEIEGLDRHINDIAFDNNGKIYIAQNNGELLIATYENDTFIVEKRLSSNNEIKGNVIKWLVCNKDNKLFVGTDNGLNYISLNTVVNDDWSFKFYNNKEGYLASESNYAISDEDGNILVNTHNGILKIEASHFDTNIMQRSVIITEVDLYHKKNDSLINITNPEFDYDENVLSFYINRNNFVNADKDVFYYRLKGITNEWAIVSKNNRVDFYNLPSGDFEFQVKCKNLNTGQLSETSSYSFTILKPWWNTILFYVLLIIFVLVISWLIIQLRVDSIRKLAKKTTAINKQIAEMEMKALQSQMNPHFVFNSINSIQNFVLDENVDDTLIYLGHFSKLLRQTFSYASEKYITIEQEQQYLTHYIALEKMRFNYSDKDAFTYNFIVDESIDETEKIFPPMLLQPIIENAIKHGEIHLIENGELTVNIKEENDFIICTITDNGIGRKAAAQKQNKHHLSKAMSIIDDRLRLLSDDGITGMKITDLEQGTLVELKLAISGS